MQKSKIVIVAVFTTIIVGVLNSISALIAYNFVIPENNYDNQSLIVANDSASSISNIEPIPDQAEPVPNEDKTTNQNIGRTNSGETVIYRNENDKLQAGQKPQPTSIVTDSSGSKVYKWCSGVNPDLPDDVCYAIVNIAANPSTTNPHLGSKARDSLSLLPKNSSIMMDENSWQNIGTDKGTMVVFASTPDLKDIKIRIYLEKLNNIWVVTDGQLA